MGASYNHPHHTAAVACDLSIEVSIAACFLQKRSRNVYLHEKVAFLGSHACNFLQMLEKY